MFSRKSILKLLGVLVAFVCSSFFGVGAMQSKQEKNMKNINVQKEDEEKKSMETLKDEIAKFHERKISEFRELRQMILKKIDEYKNIKELVYKYDTEEIGDVEYFNKLKSLLKSLKEEIPFKIREFSEENKKKLDYVNQNLEKISDKFKDQYLVKYLEKFLNGYVEGLLDSLSEIKNSNLEYIESLININL